MRNSKSLFILILASFLSISSSSYAQSWANIERYEKDNADLGAPKPGEKRVVFMGNSITDAWIHASPDFFSGKSYIDRGISGQTTPQMLARFRPDVINLKPAVVLILAGTNDIAGNTGPSTLEMIMDNIISMTELAKTSLIEVVLCSVLPAYEYSWRPEIEPAEKIMELNKMIKSYADENGIIFLDYYSDMVNEQKGLKNEFSDDGVHPNQAGYNIMEPLAEQAIKNALSKKITY